MTTLDPFARDESRAAARARIAAAAIPAWYSGRLHVLYFNVLAFAVIGWAVASVDRPTLVELALAPLFVVFANAFEWWIHRGPMHHPVPYLRELYKRHTLSHHVYFTDRDMEIESARDLKLVLFPPLALPLFILMTAPLPIAAGLVVSANAARIFFASAIGYYLIYEWLHLFHHLPQASWIGRRGWVATLRAHHTRHHDPRRMTQGNFNVSFPLWDRVRGTVLADVSSGGSSSPPPGERRDSRRGPPPSHFAALVRSRRDRPSATWLALQTVVALGRIRHRGPWPPS